MNIWMSDKIEPLIDDTLPPWADPSNPNCKTTYKLNNYGLRCDDFTLPNPKNHILFAGSEITVPENVDLEKGWAHIVYKNLCPGENNFRNLAYSGASAQRLISNIFKYFKAFGNPEKLFVLMPDITRKIGVVKNDKIFKTKLYNQYQKYENNDPEHNLFAEPNDYPLILLALEYLQYVRFLEQYCEAANIDLYWSSVDSSTNYFIKQYNFKYFFEIKLPEFERNIWGGTWHNQFANSFLEEINARNN